MATSQEAIDAFNAAGGSRQDTQDDTIFNPFEVDVMILPDLLVKDNEALENDSAFGGPTAMVGDIMLIEMPNDDDEQDRMDLLHHVFNLVLDGKLYLAPIENPQRVLDVGTGTGIWAIDFAEYVQTCLEEKRFLTSLLVNILHRMLWAVTYLQFNLAGMILFYPCANIDDVEDTWRYSQKFDFIHIRSLGGSIASWPHLLDQARDNLNEGGFIELVDFEYHGYSDDGTGELAPSFQKWQAGLDEASRLFGRDLNVAMKFKNWLEEAGFEAVVERHWRLPMAPWARDRRNKEIGLYMQQNMLDATVAYGMAHFTRILGWSPEEYQVLAAGVRNEFKDPRVHNWCNMYIVYGRKPLSSGEETIAPAVGAPVLSTGAGFVSDKEMKLGGKKYKEENKEGGNTNTREEVVDRKKIGEQESDESDFAAVVNEAADNVVAQGKGMGKSRGLEVVGEGKGDGSVLGSATTMGKGKGKGKGKSRK
ncbi:hypothetical protein BTUL_0001g01560 [Botrytis tulipae]|uniref:Methyltransferase domain-containing protein n=1 Tax=Botrytis tulipae TaxID=87230 RepID=A0A4Z1F5X6_9HELO|nr:hypothetical protein BTUL_0001g01560 [Botrytis tulipae]